MLNNVTAGIAIAIDQEFGDGYEIYTDELEQDLKEPCFFMMMLDPNIERRLSVRREVDVPMSIQYFPKKGRAECNDVAERLALYALECITPYESDTLIRGKDMHWEVVDGVLNFFVTYNFFVYKVENPKPLMETMTTVLHLKG